MHGVSRLWRTGARVDVEVMASVSWRKAGVRVVELLCRCGSGSYGFWYGVLVLWRCSGDGFRLCQEIMGWRWSKQ